MPFSQIQFNEASSSALRPLGRQCTQTWRKNLFKSARLIQFFIDSHKVYGQQVFLFLYIGKKPVHRFSKRIAFAKKSIFILFKGALVFIIFIEFKL